MPYASGAYVMVQWESLKLGMWEGGMWEGVLWPLLVQSPLAMKFDSPVPLYPFRGGGT